MTLTVKGRPSVKSGSFTTTGVNRNRSEAEMAKHTILNNEANSLSATDSTENVERVLASMDKQAQP